MALGRTAVRPVLYLVLAALVALLASTSAINAQSANSGRVRVMHASPDTPPVDILVDGQKAVTALAFPKDTGYVTLPAGAHNVKNVYAHFSASIYGIENRSQSSITSYSPSDQFPTAP